MFPAFMLTAGVLVGATVLATAVAVWQVLFPWLPRDLGGAPNLDRRARHVKIPVGMGEALDGWFVAGSKPAVVLVLHGFGRDHHRAWRYGGFLNTAGYGILAVDFRSSRAFTSGPRKPTTLGHHEVPDAVAALDWLRAEPSLAGHALGVLGESLGGSVALIVAASHRDVAAVVVDGAFATGMDALEESSERWARLPRQPTATVARWVGRVATGFDPGVTNAEQAAAMLVDRPVLFIHGLRDNRLSERQAERLWRAAGAKDVLWVIPQAGHNEGWQLLRAEYEARVSAFFDRHLGREETARGRPAIAGAIDGATAVGRAVWSA